MEEFYIDTGEQEDKSFLKSLSDERLQLTKGILENKEILLQIKSAKIEMELKKREVEKIIEERKIGVHDKKF